MKTETEKEKEQEGLQDTLPEGEEEDPSMFQLVLAELANPGSPWIAAALGGFHFLITKNPRPAVSAVVAFILLHFAAKGLLKIILLNQAHQEAREAATKNPENCVCGAVPTVYYSDDTDMYFIKCEECKRTGDVAYFVRNAVTEWDDLMERYKRKRDVE